MNILVCIKQVPDDSVEIHLNAEGTPDLANVTPVVNAFDTYALEMAARLKESSEGEVTVVCVGEDSAKNSLKNCLAVGADHAFLVSDDAFKGSDTTGIANILKNVIAKLEADNGQKFDLVFCGKEATDAALGQGGLMLAEELGTSVITNITEIALDGDKVTVKQETEEGYRTVEASAPCVVTVTKPEYDPRYPTIKNKMAARKKPIGDIKEADLADLENEKVGESNAKDMAECKNIMVYVETAEGNPVKVGLEMLSPAKKLADKVTAVVIGGGVADAAKEVAKAGADQVICVDSEDYKEFNLDAYAQVLVELVKEENPEAVFVGGTQDGKDIAPVVAAKCNTGCASDVLDIKAEDGEVIYTCPLYGGTVLEDVKIKTTPQIATLRSGAFQKVEDPTEGEVVAKEVKVADDVIKAKITESVKEIAETINLEEAEVIVSGGRGMGSKENFALVDDLAKLLGGVVGATRPAIEDGWVSKIHQVGQSGKIVAPKLYIACGISGATQHVSGIMNSGYIVAINKDEDAPIFDVANVGIVGDVMKVLPVMIEEIKKIKDAQ